MNKTKTAFSLIEAMIILVLISVGILAMVPLISQRTTSSFWREVTQTNGTTIIQYGQDLVERLGFGLDDRNTLQTAKMSTTNANIGYSANDTSIRLGRDYDTAKSSYTKTTDSIPQDKIIIGQNACRNADNAVNIGSFDSTKSDEDDCNSDAVIQVGDNDGTAIITTPEVAGGGGGAGTPTRTTLKINNQTIIDVNGNNFDINLPTNATPTDLFSYDGTTLTFSQDVIGIGDLTIEGWNPTGIASDGTPHVDCGNFIKYPDTTNTACDWFLCGSGSDYNGTTYICPTPSDRRLKNIISDYTKGFDYVSKIQTYLFKFKNDKSGRIHAGLIAQKLIGVFDEALHKDDKGYYSYDKDPILYSMVNSVKEISNRQDETSKELITMNNKADKLLKAYGK